MKRRILSLVLALTMVFTNIPVLDWNIVQAEDLASDYEFDAQTGTITKYTGSQTDIEIPSQIGGVDVRAIGKQAFAGKKLTSLVFNEGLETIGEGAFLSNNITEISLPSSLKNIEKLAFGLNKSLTSIKLNEGLVYIGQQAFRNCTSLTGIVEIPSSLEILMTSSFSGSPIDKLYVKGDETSSKLNIKSGISDKLTGIDFESPFKKAEVHFNTFGCDEKTSTINLGKVRVPASTQEELNTWLKENINLRMGASYNNDTVIDGSKDIFTEFPLTFDTSEFKLGESFQVRVSFDKDVELSPIAGYGTPDPKNCNATIDILLEVEAFSGQESQEEWASEHFTYEIQEHKGINQTPRKLLTITGFSDLGLEELAKNPDLVIPKTLPYDGVDTPVGMIASHAFENRPIRSVSFPDTQGVEDFVINTSAFTNAGIERVSFQEGLRYIEAGAFKDNKIENVFLPSTVERVGNESFANNQLKTLEISRLANQIQLDNYSFARNQLSEVDLPYSVFKIQANVFFENPSQVKLYTMNEAHLKSSTYIVAKSDYHQIILVTDEDRDELLSEILAAKNIVLSDYPSQEAESFISVLNKAIEVFTNEEASQEDINKASQDIRDAKDRLYSTAPDKLGLREVLKRAEQVDESITSPETYAPLEVAMNQARDILAKEPTKEEIDQAIKDLEDALIGLELIEEAKYTKADFTYEGNKITGFSDQGKAKFLLNKDLVLPNESPEGLVIKEIGPNAFEAPSDMVDFGTDISNTPLGLRTVKLPDQLEVIGPSAFRYQNIQNISLPETLTSIGAMAFNGNKIKYLYLPDATTNIGGGAFGLNKISDLRLSPNMTEIASGVFTRNYELTSLSLHEGITKIGSSAFWGCRISSLDLPSTLKEIGANAFNSHRIETLTIPDGVEKIGASAFSQNPKWMRLKTLVLGDGLKEIGSKAFQNSLLTSVDLPYNLVKMNKDAFNGNIDEYKNPVVVKLYTTNPDHLKIETDKSSEIILMETIPSEIRVSFEVDPAKGEFKPDENGATYPTRVLAGGFDASKLKDMAPEVVAKEGYKFIGWDKAFEGMLVEDTVYTALFEKLEDTETEKPNRPSRPSKPSRPEETDPADKPGQEEKIDMTRTYGQDRYQTALAIVRENFKEADTLVLASGEVFPDSLAASSLAGLYKGPILLTSPGMLEEIKEEIQRLGIKNIILVGGQASISQEEENFYKTLGQVERLAGADRYQTALKLAEAILEETGGKKLIIADGRAYPDALAIGPVAAKENTPIILARADSLPGAENLIDKYKIEEALIVGGQNSVGQVGGQIEEVGRISGANRYETAVKIAEEYFPGVKEIALASGQTYPDALVLGPVLGQGDLALLLSPKEKLDKSVEDYIKENKIEKVHMYGGPSSLGEDLFK